MKFLFYMCFVAVAFCSVSAQSRVITNDDLAKYRQQREQAERDYRENYARMGFPSPDELARRREKSALEYREYADQLRTQELEAERLAAQRRAASRYLPPVYVIGGDSGYGDLGYFFLNGRYYQRPLRQEYAQPGYFAGGQFWPTGSATRPRPLIERRPR